MCTIEIESAVVLMNFILIDAPPSQWNSDVVNDVSLLVAKGAAKYGRQDRADVM